MDARDLIDLDRFPIDRPDSDAYRDLVARCRSSLDATALCHLHGFVRPDALAEMAREIAELQDNRLSIDQPCTVYPWMDNSGFAPDHPRSTLFTRHFSYLITDRIPGGSLVNRLYQWDVLTDFVRDALGFDQLYRSICDTQSLQVNYMYEGDSLPWHFDTNDGVVSLLLAEADEGGLFQVAPYIRDEEDEHYDDVERAFTGDPALVTEPPLKPGTFALFRGRRSMHQVSPVGSTRDPRMVALFSYDRRPDMRFTKDSCDKLRYPDPTPFLGSRTPPGTTGFTLRQTCRDLRRA